MHGRCTLLSCPVRMASLAYATQVVIAVIRWITDVVHLGRRCTPAMRMQLACWIPVQDAGAYHPVPVRGEGYGTPLAGTPRSGCAVPAHTYQGRYSNPLAHGGKRGGYVVAQSTGHLTVLPTSAGQGV